MIDTSKLADLNKVIVARKFLASAPLEACRCMDCELTYRDDDCGIELQSSWAKRMIHARQRKDQNTLACITALERAIDALRGGDVWEEAHNEAALEDIEKILTGGVK